MRFPDKGSGINCCYPLQRDVLASYSMRCVPPQSNIKCPTPFGHALDLMKVQVEEHGAKALKFYNVRYDYGQPFPWRMDDPRVAYPAFEQALKLGVNLIGVHKGVPLGPQPIEHTQTWDVDGAAAKFRTS